MHKIAYRKDTIIHHSGDVLDKISVILKGLVSITTPYGSVSLKIDDYIGLLDVSSKSHTYQYIATTDVIVAVYDFTGKNPLSNLISQDSQLSKSLVLSVIHQMNQIAAQYSYLTFEYDNLFHFINDSYEDYSSICKKHLLPIQELDSIDEISLFAEVESSDSWILNYYESFTDLPILELQSLLEKNPAFSLALIMRASLDSSVIYVNCQSCITLSEKLIKLLFSSDSIDLLTLLTNLHCHCLKNEISDSTLNTTIENLIYFLNGIAHLDKELYKSKMKTYQQNIQLTHKQNSEILSPTEDMDITDSLAFILHYSNCSEEIISTFKNLFQEYKKENESSSGTDGTMILRKKLIPMFYTIYIGVFLKSLEDNSVPIIIKMFLYFGYMDEELAGRDNALSLQELASSISEESSPGIYTFYDWLLAIYHGKKEPSRNEFDTDYSSYLLELKSKGKVTEEQRVKLMKNGREKVLFELRNIFPIVNKITVGRITGYCPIFSGQNVVQNLSTSFLSTSKVKAGLDLILALDHTAFHRETIYTNPESRIEKEYLQKQILPDIILMPSLGTMGVMWQEIEGKRRSTPARMILPILSTADLTTQLMQLTGEFRWELCKRIQGSRWNDVTNHSLTSEYCDYIQFYKKNKDLTADAKEKIKIALTQARNISKNAFVQDYLLWLQYEKSGSPRLNKVSRNILFTYCPFTEDIRSKLSTNPMYNDSLSKFTIMQKKRLRHFALIERRLAASGIDLPQEITDEMNLLKM